MKLHIGCGLDYKEGYINIDMDPSSKADVVCDLFKLGDEYKGATEIWCQSTLEHFGFNRVPAVLRKFRELLQPGGELTLIVPDLDYICNLWLITKDTYRYTEGIQLIFGNQTNEGQFHKSGFTLEYLRDMMTHNGFKEKITAFIWDCGQRELLWKGTT